MPQFDVACPLSGDADGAAGHLQRPRPAVRRLRSGSSSSRSCSDAKLAQHALDDTVRPCHIEGERPAEIGELAADRVNVLGQQTSVQQLRCRCAAQTPQRADPRRFTRASSDIGSAPLASKAASISYSVGRLRGPSPNAAMSSRGGWPTTAPIVSNPARGTIE